MPVVRPTGVVVAAALQLLLAVAFLISATVALLYGPAAQAAGEAELVRQGFAPDVLTSLLSGSAVPMRARRRGCPATRVARRVGVRRAWRVYVAGGGGHGSGLHLAS